MVGLFLTLLYILGQYDFLTFQSCKKRRDQHRANNRIGRAKRTDFVKDSGNDEKQGCLKNGE